MCVTIYTHTHIYIYIYILCCVTMQYFLRCTCCMAQPSIACDLLCVARLRVVCAILYAMHPFYLWVPCPSLRPTYHYPFWHLIFGCSPHYFRRVFYFFIFLCSRWSFVDVPLIHIFLFSKPRTGSVTTHIGWFTG